MSTLVNKALVMGVIGLLGAVASDLDAWRGGITHVDGEAYWPPFDWAKALRRWVAGAFVGVSGAFGFGL